jgi:hypothetical protein
MTDTTRMVPHPVNGRLYCGATWLIETDVTGYCPVWLWKCVGCGGVLHAQPNRAPTPCDCGRANYD